MEVCIFFGILILGMQAQLITDKNKADGVVFPGTVPYDEFYDDRYTRESSNSMRKYLHSLSHVNEVFLK